MTLLNDFIKDSGKSITSSLDTITYQFFFILAFFLVDPLISNTIAKLFFLIGYAFVSILFYVISYTFFKASEESELTFLTNFSLYIFAFTIGYWLYLNLVQSSNIILLLYYITLLILYSVYIIYSKKETSYIYGIGSIIVGLLMGILWAFLIKSKIQETQQQHQQEDTSQIIDLNKDKNVKCQVFRI